MLNELTSTCNDVIVHRNRRTPERSNDPRSAPRGFRIDHIVQIFEIQMNREHMEPKCCPPMGPPPSGSPSHTVKRAGAPGCARSAPALRAGRRVALAQELWSQTYTARSPCPSWCVTARDRASRAFVEADPVLTSLKWVNLTLDCLNLTCICYRVCVVPRLTLLLWVHVCVVCGVCGGPWSVDYLV